VLGSAVRTLVVVSVVLGTVASLACSAQPQGADEGTGGGGSTATSGGSNSPSGGETATGGDVQSTGGTSAGGSDGALCADAESDPEPVVPPESLRVRFELLYDPDLDDPLRLGSSFDYVEQCGDGGLYEGQELGLAPWGECIAKNYLEATNAAFRELLGSDVPLLVFDSFTTTPEPTLARGLSSTELADAIGPLTQAGFINVFIVPDIGGNAGGVAYVSQAYPDEQSGVGLAVEGLGPPTGIAHELGHAMGFPHVSGPGTSGTVSYACCGGLQVEAVTGPCPPDGNIMCEGTGASFNSCEHGRFLKQIAACWLASKGDSSCRGQQPAD
jgi:Metallo-peptidase family M12B Reprolysin-like